MLTPMKLIARVNSQDKTYRVYVKPQLIEYTITVENGTGTEKTLHTGIGIHDALQGEINDNLNRLMGTKKYG